MRANVFRFLAALGLCLIAACNSRSLALIPTAELSAGLPPLAMLDGLRGAAALDAQFIPVESPLSSANTAPNGGNLDFGAPFGPLAWAIWRVSPPTGTLLSLDCGGSDTLWVLAADYGAGRWSWAIQLSGGLAQLDLTAFDDLTSPGGYCYFAVACAPGDSGTLELLALMYDSAPTYGLTVTPNAANGSIMLSWDSGASFAWLIYRSTLPGDPQPYLVATVDDAAPAQNVWVEYCAKDPADDTWVPYEDDSGTPAFRDDDFPWIAPEVDYYYSVQPVSGGPILEPSVEVHTLLPWGTRRTTRRALPGTTNLTRVFADQLIPGDMTAPQVQWCAENLVGTQKIFKGQADDFRQYNPDFLVLGYHLGVGAGDIGNTSGLTWDDNSDWPYVNAHEDWFMHPAGSGQPGGRALQQDWNWYGADPDSAWQDYLAAHLSQMLGENYFDGWFVDSCSELWNTDPAQWWPGANNSTAMFAYFTPKLNTMLHTVTEVAAAHPLQPYIIPNAGNYVTTVSDIKYYGADWACDGIMIEGHAHWSPGSYYSQADWELQHDRILDHQAQGLATILQTSIFTPDQQDRLFVYASYLLVRGARTYINWLGDDGLDTIWYNLPQWYPEFDIDAELGPPSAAPPAALTGMWDAGLGLYKRQFGMGFVLINPSDASVTYTCPWNMLKLTVSGGGNVDAGGNAQGSHSWTVINGAQTMPAHSALIILDILD